MKGLPSVTKSLSRRTLVIGLMVLVASPAMAQFSDSYNFLKAVKDKDVLKAKSFIDKPGSTLVNTRDGDSGDTALHIVTRRRDTPWMGFLLQNGADPNARDKDGNTPMMVAAMTGFTEGVRVMIAGRGQVDMANGRGETALIKAVHGRDAQTAALLLSAGADPDRPDNQTGLSAREYAARDSRGGPVAKLMAEAPKKGAKKAVGPQL
jgi:ankyrin repeat protein